MEPPPSRITPPPDPGRQRAQERIAALERKLRAENEVPAALMEEHVALRKVLGKADGPLGASTRSSTIASEIAWL